MQLCHSIKESRTFCLRIGSKKPILSNDDQPTSKNRLKKSMKRKKKEKEKRKERACNVNRIIREYTSNYRDSNLDSSDGDYPSRPFGSFVTTIGRYRILRGERERGYEEEDYDGKACVAQERRFQSKKGPGVQFCPAHPTRGFRRPWSH